MFQYLRRWYLQSDISQRREWGAVVGAVVSVIVAFGYYLTRDTSLRAYDLYYNVPIAAPFGAFLIERLSGSRRGPSMLVDAVVVGMSLARVAFPVPGYSGHALFLLFALTTARGRGIRILSSLVLLEVLVIKLAWWGDFVTVVGSVALGVTASVIYRRIRVPPTREKSFAGPYRTAWSERTARTHTSFAAPLLFVIGCCIWLAVGYWRTAFDPGQWRQDTSYGDGHWVDAPGYRTTRAARAAARRLRGRSTNDVCDLLGCDPRSFADNSRTHVFYYDLAERCGALFSMTTCSFAVEVDDSRVVAAWLHDTDGAPWSIECLYGCSRADMQDRMRPER